MAKSRWPGAGKNWPSWPIYLSSIGAPSLDSSTLTLSANANGKVIFIGHLMWDDGGTYDIHKIHGRTGTVTAGTFQLAGSIRAVDTANGPPGRDDGSIIQGANVSAQTATTNFTVTLASDITSVASGTLYAVVFYYSSYTSGSIRIASVANLTSSAIAHRPMSTLYDGTTYTVGTGIVPCVTIEDSTGNHFAVLEGALPVVTAVNTHTFNSSSNPEIYGLAYTVTEPLWFNAAAVLDTTVASGSYDLKHYTGDTATATIGSVDYHTWNANANTKWTRLGTVDTAIVSGSQYYMAVVPGATNTTIYSLDFVSTGQRNAFFGTMQYSTFHTSAWAALTATRVLVAQIGLVASDGGGGGSGGNANILTGSVVK